MMGHFCLAMDRPDYRLICIIFCPRQLPAGITTPGGDFGEPFLHPVTLVRSGSSEDALKSK